MIEEACSKTGLTYSAFLNLTLYQYRLHVEQISYDRNKAWEHTRHLSYLIYSALVPKNERVSMAEYMPLATDTPISIEENQTEPAEIERIKQLALERISLLRK